MQVVLIGICFAFVLVEVLRIGRYIPRKPFTCGMCLSGWVTLGLCLYQQQNPGLMFVAMVSYIFMEKTIHRL